MTNTMKKSHCEIKKLAKLMPGFSIRKEGTNDEQVTLIDTIFQKEVVVQIRKTDVPNEGIRIRVAIDAYLDKISNRIQKQKRSI